MVAGLSPSLPVFAIGGSRSLSLAGRDLAAWVAERLLAGGATLAVGCATGADAAVLRKAVQLRQGSRLQVFTAFGPVTGSRGAFAVAGTGACSDPWAVRDAAAAGARVKAWAGGDPGLALPARLANRTRAVVSAATHGGVIIIEGHWGLGSLLLARSLAARGLPVWALTVPGAQNAPPPIPGHWRWVCPEGLGGFPAWHLPAAGSQSSLTLAA